MPLNKLHITFSLILLLCGMWMHAQERQITLQYNNTPIREILDDIERQSGLSFSYSNRLLDHNERVRVNVQNASVEDALKAVFMGMPIRPILMEKQIVLKKERRKKKEEVTETEEPVVEKRYTISGYAKDVATGEILIGATIALSDGSLGTISNNYGFYSLTLNAPADSIVCTYVGYGKISRAVQPQTQRMDFQLKEHLQSIKEVVVIGDEFKETIRTSRSSEQRIKSETVRKMPALFGEKDVIKSLAAIPGIKFFGDGSTIFYVRGGARDQNFITIDEAPVYNPAHLMGFFSTVVPDAVKDVQVYKGDFPANYGGRLSSLIDIRTKDGNMNQFSMDGSYGLLSSKLTLEGPIWKDHISWFLSGRSSHILRLAQRGNENIQDLSFGDVHFKLNYKINPKNRVFLAFYTSKDNFENKETRGSISGINWENRTATLRWNRVIDDDLFMNTTFYASNYEYYFNSDKSSGNYWKSHINSFGLKSDFTLYVSPRNTLRYGARIAQHFMNPGNYYLGHQIMTLPYGLEISTKSVNEANVYISDQLIVSDRLSLRGGLRFTTWSNIGSATEYFFDDGFETRTYGSGEVYNVEFAADPRLGLVYKLDNEDLLKASFSRTSQFEHLITNSVSPFSSLEVWLPSGPHIKPQRASQITLGYLHNFKEKKLIAEAEVYIKQMENQIDYLDHANLILNPFIEAELRFGEGTAYGLETQLSKKYGRLTGWVSYTLSRSMLTIEDINQGNPYPSYGDRPHDFSLFLAYQLSPRLNFTSNFTYMTGAPITTPTAFYYHDNVQIPIYYKRNNDRLPDYHRLDVALNWNLRKREGRFKHELIFSIYNLYARKNPVAVHFNKIENNAGNLVTPYNFYEKPLLVPTMLYIYTIVPSVSYHFKF